MIYAQKYLVALNAASSISALSLGQCWGCRVKIVGKGERVA